MLILQTVPAALLAHCRGQGALDASADCELSAVSYYIPTYSTLPHIHTTYRLQTRYLSICWSNLPSSAYAHTAIVNALYAGVHGRPCSGIPSRVDRKKTCCLATHIRPHVHVWATGLPSARAGARALCVGQLSKLLAALVTPDFPRMISSVTSKNLAPLQLP
ncbi:hypothetical protein F4780DRAFT_423869 [Xylariomycetidae sp. FL0641]|nr:hypothetical protein F4780DRAFT_423869 [Xylariomycetidae sp. FL0641]